MARQCPICEESKIERIPINFTLFTHFGFTDFGRDGMIGRCTNCQLLINMMPISRERKLSTICNSPDYARGGITGQTYFVKDYDRRVTRAFLQAEILERYLENSERTRVLDVGCFGGELLLELSRRFPKAEFHGFDTNKHLKAVFPSKKNFYFWLSELERIEGKFDLICMSCSMMYIKDLNGLLKNLRRLIKAEGSLFIQINDVASNPYSILLGDQYFYFTPHILKNILKKAGFNFTLLKNDWFPRDMVGIAKLADDKQSCGFKEDLNVYRSVSHLNRIKRKLQFLANGSPLCVLGTTTTAAFVDGVLGKKIQCFVDENTNCAAVNFRGKKVVHPRLLDESYCLILPYGPANRSIKQRFHEVYHLKEFQLI